ncbi:MAG: DNA polymerase III subunit chi [Alphaproteobacteria bacterium]
MTEIRFYHLQKTALDDALPALLQKVMDMDYKSDVIINGDVKEFSDILWENNNKNSFIANDIGDNINENSPVAIYNNLNVKVENLRKNRFFY